MQKTAKGKQHGTLLAGVAILLVALGIIFVTIAVPRARENTILEERLDVLLHAEYERVVLSDPLYKDASAPLDRGVEVMLTAAQTDAMRALLQTVAQGGFHNVENKSLVGGAWDMKCQLRKPDGARADLYFTDAALYFYADGTAFCFEAKDLNAYNALYVYLRSLFTKAA